MWKANVNQGHSVSRSNHHYPDSIEYASQRPTTVARQPLRLPAPPPPSSRSSTTRPRDRSVEAPRTHSSYSSNHPHQPPRLPAPPPASSHSKSKISSSYPSGSNYRNMAELPYHASSSVNSRSKHSTTSRSSYKDARQLVPYDGRRY